MPDTTGKVQNTDWPIPKFKFKVAFARQKFVMHFSEVSGLDAEAQVIQYRDGDSPGSHVVKMPGLQKFSNISLKRGVVVGGNGFIEWLSLIKANTNTNGRDTITIELLNENDKPTMSWVLHQAWPTSITTADMKSDANDAAIDTLVIAYERLEIKKLNNS